MLVVTESAAEAIKDVVTSFGLSEDGGVRITLEPVDAETARLDVAVTENAEPGDALVEQAGANIYVEESAASMLQGKILDATVTSDGVEFSIVDPPSSFSSNGRGSH